MGPPTCAKVVTIPPARVAGPPKAAANVPPAVGGNGNGLVDRRVRQQPQKIAGLQHVVLVRHKADEVERIAAGKVGTGAKSASPLEAKSARAGSQRRSPQKRSQLAMQRARKSVHGGKLRPGHLRPFQVKLPMLIGKRLLLARSGEGRSELPHRVELFQVRAGRIDRPGNNKRIRNHRVSFTTESCLC
jgi:hypothetical protein